jgi:hypothetical protein
VKGTRTARADTNTRKNVQAASVTYFMRAYSRMSGLSWRYLAALAAIAIISRLPQLVTPNLLADGDECILGLMAKHFAEGRSFPLFFYGQDYGLSIVEAPAAAVAFLIVGVATIPLKLAMLSVWIIGVCSYFLAFAQTLGRTRAFWIVLLLVLMPAWAVSSMKAWSGYITAFCATGAIFYFLTRDELSRPTCAAAGGLTAIVYLSQPSWLPGLLPVVAILLLSSRRPAAAFSYIGGMTIALFAIAVLKLILIGNAVPSWGRPAAGNPNLVGSLPPLLKQLYLNMSGSYYLATPVPAGPFTTIVAIIWLTILTFCVALQIYRLCARKYHFWTHVLFVSVIFTLVANWLLLDSRHPRYLLSMSAPLVLLAGFEFFDFVDRRGFSTRRVVAIILMLVALEGVSMAEFRHYTYMWWHNDSARPSEARTLQHVNNYMKSRGVTHAYSMNALLQWQISFYSGESVIARWKVTDDRYPRYISEVDGALNRGEPVAIVGYVGYTSGLENLVADRRGLVEFDGKYFVFVGADRQLLTRLGFRLTYTEPSRSAVP